jgi:amidohydrolase family protein
MQQKAMNSMNKLRGRTMNGLVSGRVRRPLLVGLTATFFLFNAASVWAETSNYEFNDSHFHLTNNIQEGPGIREFVGMMGDRAGRAILSGIPLQQEWSYRVDGDRAPSYYLHSDAPLYYYSFTDAAVAMAYKSLRKEQQARFDPMITGFNPADMYAADHVRRVLETFPGVFTGIGEFTIHKEFVAGKIPGEVASLQNPALDRLLDFAAEVGLVVLIHNDIDVPFAKEGSEPAYLGEIRTLFKRHRNATIIWAHMGLGRTVRPGKNHAMQIEEILKHPDLDHVYFDLAWDEVAKYFVGSPEATAAIAALIQQYPNRFLFGTDAVAPADQSKYVAVFNQYQPLWNSLDAKTSRKVRLENYERIFDEGRRKVRSWESAHVPAVRSKNAETRISSN